MWFTTPEWYEPEVKFKQSNRIAEFLWGHTDFDWYSHFDMWKYLGGTSYVDKKLALLSWQSFFLDARFYMYDKQDPLTKEEVLSSSSICPRDVYYRESVWSEEWTLYSEDSCSDFELLVEDGVVRIFSGRMWFDDLSWNGRFVRRENDWLYFVEVLEQQQVPEP